MPALLPHWAQLTPAERDVAFDNSAAVPRSAALKAERVRASRCFRRLHPDHLDQAYGPRPRQRWDLYPGAREDSPCLIFIHGGYWQFNDKVEFACIAEGLASQGWAAAMPGYSLAPEVRLMDIVAEIETALDWFAVHAPLRGLSGPVLLSGWSAGATLALLHLGHDAVHAGLAISPLAELSHLRDTKLNAALSLSDLEVERFSPLRRPIARKPLTIAYGHDELPALVQNSRSLQARLGEQGARLKVVPAANHFTVLDALRRPDGALAKAARRMIRIAPDHATRP